MYESFFRLKARPFAAAPVVHHYYPGEAIEQARQTCVRAIERAEGPVLVIGPAGVGKTLLCRLLAAYFESEFHVALLSNTRIGTHKALLQNILFELTLPYRNLDEGELRLRLIDFLQPSDECPNGVLLIIDEAHTLPIRLLEELRMLTNVVREGQSRVRLVLAGGSRLDERFAHPKLESFNQRVAARCYLPPMNRMETDDYVRAQLAVAGGSADVIFGEAAFRAVFQATDGIPRLVNQICNHALTLACQAGCRKLEAVNIEEAWADLQQLPAPWQEKCVEADNSRAFIEFGQLDAGFEEAGSSALDLGGSPVSRCDEMLELLSSGQGEMSPSIVFGSMGAEIHDALGFDIPSDEAMAEEPEAQLAPEESPEPLIQPAVNPFEVEFAQEEVIQDPIALAASPRNRMPESAAEATTTRDASEHSAPRPAQADEAESLLGREPQPPVPAAECCLSPSTNDPPVGDRTAQPETADEDTDRVAVTAEESWDDLLTISPAEQESFPTPPIPCGPEMFEYTILQELNAGSLILDTTGLFAQPAPLPAEPEDEAPDSCVSFALDADSPGDDRDLIQVDDDEDSRAKSDQSPASEHGSVRHVEYRTLFAQLRRNG